MEQFHSQSGKPQTFSLPITKNIPKTKKKQKQKDMKLKFTMLRSCARSYFIPGQGDRRLFIIRGESSNLACQCPSESKDSCQGMKFDKRLKSKTLSKFDKRLKSKTLSKF